jgi:TonB family protein
MKYGKKVCTSLKQVRKQIADANGIPYEITPCPHDGSQCPGTCTKCESEVRYIERELSLRRAAGKAVSLVGLSLGISAAFAANAPQASAKNDIKNSIAVETSTPNDTTATEENMIFGLIEQQAEFPGGEAALMAFIKKNLKYPADAARDSIEGRVVLTYMVELDGSITEIEVMRSPDERLTKEAIRVIKTMPKWKPERRLGKPVRTKYVLPITFRLNAAQQKSKNVNPSATKTEKADTAASGKDMIFEGKPVQQPEFPGGETALMNFIVSNLKYPQSAAQKGIQGRVTLSFIVEKDGSISTIKVVRSPDERLSLEAIRVVRKMPKWTPAKQEGKPVRVKYVLPVTFRLR